MANTRTQWAKTGALHVITGAMQARNTIRVVVIPLVRARAA
jgi:hypothetical protein